MDLNILRASPAPPLSRGLTNYPRISCEPTVIKAQLRTAALPPSAPRERAWGLGADGSPAAECGHESGRQRGPAGAALPSWSPRDPPRCPSLQPPPLRSYGTPPPSSHGGSGPHPRPRRPPRRAPASSLPPPHRSVRRRARPAAVPPSAPLSPAARPCPLRARTPGRPMVSAWGGGGRAGVRSRVKAERCEMLSFAQLLLEPGGFGMRCRRPRGGAGQSRGVDAVLLLSMYLCCEWERGRARRTAICVRGAEHRRARKAAPQSKAHIGGAALCRALP